jgi:hypothetical protein
MEIETLRGMDSVSSLGIPNSVSESVRKRYTVLVYRMNSLIKDAQLSFNQPQVDTKETSEGAGEVKLSVRVLSSMVWPRLRLLPSAQRYAAQRDPAHVHNWRGLQINGNFTQSQTEIREGGGDWPGGYLLPVAVQRRWDMFAKAYSQAYPQRRIQYISHMGTADMNIWLGGRRYQVSLKSTEMMCVLMRFNFFEECSYAEIQASTCIPDDELSRALFSLISPPPGTSATTGLLMRVPSDSEATGGSMSIPKQQKKDGEQRKVPAITFKKEEMFRVNNAFVSRLSKFTIPNRKVVRQNI